MLASITVNRCQVSAMIHHTNVFSFEPVFIGIKGFNTMVAVSWFGATFMPVFA